MKGLLLKDWYCLRWHWLGFAALCIVIGITCVFLGNNWIGYSLILIVTSLNVQGFMSNDEESKWRTYRLTLPCSMKEVIISRYIVGIIIQLTGAAAVIISESVRMITGNGFDPEELILNSGVYLLMSFMGCEFIYPVMYRFGLRKEVLFYSIVLIMLISTSVFAEDICSLMLKNTGDGFQIIIGVCMIGGCALIHILSCRCSLIYCKKERS